MTNKTGLRQRTIKNSIQFSGVGLHSGKKVTVELTPALAHSGITFIRHDLDPRFFIKANPDAVTDTSLATRLGTEPYTVATIEHFLAALYGFGIDNIVVRLDAPEMPILDGSAAPFLALLQEAGIQELSAPKKVLQIQSVVEVIDPKNPERFVRIEPSKKPLISYMIQFNNPAIGNQVVTLDLTSSIFCQELSYARTFGLQEHVDAMKARGLALGGSLDNALVFGTHGVHNHNGLRIADECVRHKALDCIGDLYLLGMPILGHIIAYKAGHDLHTQLAKKIVAELSQHVILQDAAQVQKYAVISDLAEVFKGLSAIKELTHICG